MLPYFWYMLKVIICSGILFGYYWLFLRNKIFHRYNRFYLLASMVLSLLLPLLKINFWQPVTQQSQAIRVFQALSVGDEYMNNIVITAHKSTWSFEQLYAMVYWLVSVIFFFFLIRTLYLIRALLKKYPVRKVEDVAFVNTEDDSTPFSFLKYIFWNSSIDMDTTTGRQIFKHEVAHIQEKHTHDKLFVNIILIFCWCNPVFWLYRKELNMIHEFIADKKAVEDSDTAAFAAMILQAAYPKHRFELANNFFYSPIKRRLRMLTKNNNPRVNYFGRVMVLPLAVLVFAAFTFKAKTASKNITPQNSYGPIINKQLLLSDTTPAVTFINTKHAGSQYLKTEEYKNKALVIVDSKEIGNVGIDYVERSTERYSTVVVYNPEEAQKQFGAKGRYGIIKLTQKDATFIRADSIFFNEKTKSIKLGGANTTVTGDFSNSLIYLDHKIITPEELNKIPPSRISSIDILKADKLDGIVNANGKTSVIYVSLIPDDLPEVVVVSSAVKKETPVAIALDKMNVFYIGVDNPITIAVPEVPSDKLLVNIDNGSITGSNGKYIVRVTRLSEAIIKVATIKNEQKVLLSTQTFRVKRLPDPVDGKLAIDFDAKYKFDSSNTLQLKETQQLLLEFQAKSKLDLAEKVIVEKKLHDQELQYLKQALSLQDQQNKAGLNSAEKILLEKKVQDQQLQYLKQKNLLEQQNKAKLDEVEKSLLQLKFTEADKEKAILYEKELQARQNKMVFSEVEISPQFTGGEEAWRKYLVKNLKATLPVEEGWKAGKYTIIVKFIVHTDGTVSAVTTENYKNSKTSQHCIDIIKNAPKWQPAIQNGIKVNAYKKQPITFVIEE